jgi:hypothetical protein
MEVTFGHLSIPILLCPTHGPLKLRTLHFGDITIIYESKVSEQNIFPWLKGTIESRPPTKFQINCSFK